MRLLPESLFGRTLLILGAGLLVAQAASVLINFFDRGGSVYRLASAQIATRIAQNSRLLNRLPPSERRKVIEVVDGPHLRVSLSERPVPVAPGYQEHDPYEQAFARALSRQIGQPWPVSVEISALPREAARGGTNSSGLELWIGRYFYYLLPGGFSLFAQVSLEDGTVAVFSATIPQEPFSRLESLVPQLILLVAVCFVLAAAVVYMTTRSLDRLARAADAVGANAQGPSVPVSGPSEIRRVIFAFNRMQSRMRSYLLERSRMLGAISHDLKTPISRLRLRCELLPDAALRAKVARDLDEMESMVESSIEFFKGIEREPHRRPIDVDALVSTIAEDREQAGQPLEVRGAALAPYAGDSQSLRRCIENLVENALRYAGPATIEIADSARELRILVRDSGPGIPESDLERVFEPYVRLEGSRNPGSGGTGLGLSIARNITRAHGGDVVLRNASGGNGLIAEVVLPRQPLG
jgi:signal transduction histidine kinase